MITNRRCWIEPLSSLRDFLFWLDELPSHKWLGYFQKAVSASATSRKKQEGELSLQEILNEQVAMKLV